MKDISLTDSKSFFSFLWFLLYPEISLIILRVSTNFQAKDLRSRNDEINEVYSSTSRKKGVEKYLEIQK